MPDDKKYPRIGVGVMIQNERGEVLIGLRKGAHGAGEWSFPGGHLDFGETIFETARREVLEETGLTVGKLELFSVSDDFRYVDSHGKHYVTIGVQAKYVGGEPQTMEPDRCSGWRWSPLDALPEPLFEGVRWMTQNFRNKNIYEPAVKKETIKN
ncbi:MAG: NUDIX domain-containing protein [bacterium]